MSLVTRSRAPLGTPAPARPRSGPGLGRTAVREALRDRGLLVQAFTVPLVVLVLAVLAGHVLGLDRPRAVVVAGDPAAVGALVDALGESGDAVDGAGDRLGAPGPGVDATVVVAPDADRATIRLSHRASFAAGDLRQEVTAAVPGARVEVLGPGGDVVHDSSGQLLPGAVVLTALVLALPGTAGRVVAWRRRGVLDVLLPAVAGRYGSVGAALRLALLLVPSRWLLTLPAVVVAVLGCAATGVLSLDVASCVGFATVVLLGSAACTTLGVLVGCLLRSRREARAVLWPAVAVVAVFGLVLLPPPVLPDPAAAVLRWTPPAVFADGLRTALTATPGTSPAIAAAVLAVVLAAATAVLVRWFRTALRPER